MNLNMRNWYFPQWLTNILLIVFLITLYNCPYVLFGSFKYGGVTPFTVIATPIILYGHLHNFGLQADLTLEEFIIRFIPGIAIIVIEIFFALVAAFIFKRVIYWKELAALMAVMIPYVISGIYCYSKVETKTVSYEELEKMMK